MVSSLTARLRELRSDSSVSESCFFFGLTTTQAIAIATGVVFRLERASETNPAAITAEAL